MFSLIRSACLIASLVQYNPGLIFFLSRLQCFLRIGGEKARCKMIAAFDPEAESEYFSSLL